MRQNLLFELINDLFDDGLIDKINEKKSTIEKTINSLQKEYNTIPKTSKTENKRYDMRKEIKKNERILKTINRIKESLFS